MATVKQNTFTSYDFTDRELLSGSVLTGEQKNVIQNELATIAESRLAIDYDPANPLAFVQQEAFLKGQISILRVMLIRSDECEMQLRRHQGDNSHNS
jgi:hypothetical protein